MSYLSHFFKDTLHITFQEYLNKQRFEYACGLLRTTDKSLTEISNLSGFSDVRYFIRLCEHTYGCSPQEYRSAHPPRFVEHPESTLQRICPPEECRELLADAHAKTCESLSKCSVWQFFHNWSFGYLLALKELKRLLSLYLFVSLERKGSSPILSSAAALFMIVTTNKESRGNATFTRTRMNMF